MLPRGFKTQRKSVRLRFEVADAGEGELASALALKAVGDEQPAAVVVLEVVGVDGAAGA